MALQQISNQADSKGYCKRVVRGTCFSEEDFVDTLLCIGSCVSNSTNLGNLIGVENIPWSNLLLFYDRMNVSNKRPANVICISWK